jgi:hypothetical protein
MGLATVYMKEAVVRVLDELPSERVTEVLDFALFLKQRSQTSPRFPYGVTVDEAQATLSEVREEVLTLYGGQAPPADQPYFGGVTWHEYQALSDEQRRALWDRAYSEFDVAIEDLEEHDVRPDALVAG